MHPDSEEMMVSVGRSIIKGYRKLEGLGMDSDVQENKL